MTDADLIAGNLEHRHVYEITGGSGGVFGADCACGDHLNEGNGAVVGGRAKVRAAIERYEAAQ